MTELGARLIAGDVAGLARACRVLDERAAGHEELARELFFRAGKARVVGVTGAPGAGKSTLVDALIAALRAQGGKVGVVAVDPSSPFTGGALLGDRIRMQSHAADEGVFIRSLATRGAQGGLSRSAFDVVNALDCWGAEHVLVETVGVGQAELDVLGLAGTVVVVVAPGMGDDVQANKAGILEIADVLVVNKADLDGADRAEHDLAMALSLGGRDSFEPAIVRTVATRRAGVAELVAALDTHAAFLRDTEEGRARHEARRRRHLTELLRALVAEKLMAELAPFVERAVSHLLTRRHDPQHGRDEVLRELAGAAARRE